MEKIVGFDIGESSVKLVYFAGADLKKAVTAELPDNMVSGSRILSIHNIVQYNLICTGSDIIHQSDPSHHILRFQLFRHTLFSCHFLYQILRHITRRSINFSKVFI